MNIYQNLKTACFVRGIRIKEAERKAGIGYNSSQNWSDHIPTADKLLKVAKVLNTTMEYMMGETDDIDAKVTNETPEAASISPDEMELLQIYRAVSIEGKAAILTAARAFAGQVDYTKKDAASVTA